MNQRIRYPRKVVPAKYNKKVVVTTLPGWVLLQIPSGMAVLSKEHVKELVETLSELT